MPVAKCPECDEDVMVANGKAELNDLVNCADCGAELEIISLDPLELEIYEEPYEEDLYDDEDNDEY